jgi:hypothetical protein
VRGRGSAGHLAPNCFLVVRRPGALAASGAATTSKKVAADALSFHVGSMPR